MPVLEHASIAVIGLGYVGLPLATAFGARYPTLGFDIRESRISALRAGDDETREVSARELAEAKHLSFSCQSEDLRGCTVFVITVPTPVDEARRPDFSPLLAASRTVGGALKAGDVVIYESTVYPGATEEVCVPVLEQVSGLRFNTDFTVGYSPERINPGDHTRRLNNICKVTSGSTPEAADFVDALYASVIAAGTHKASSIRVAEAAKVIENTQRDVNIALINEIALICHRLGIDTNEVLDAAGTKWNFLPFRPGLVGGHCIGVDPYYLTHKAQQLGYHPDVILAGRRINDGMGAYVAAETVRLVAASGAALKGAQVLVLGLAFKENCPDIRNTRVIDIVRALQGFGIEVHVWDPVAHAAEALREYGIKLCQPHQLARLDGVVAAVGHQEFLGAAPAQLAALKARACVPFVDVKAVHDAGALRALGFEVWRL